MVIVAVIVLWNIFNPLLREKSKDININVLNDNIQIRGAGFYATGAYRINIERVAGNDKIDSLAIVFEDDRNNIHTETISENLPQSLESKIYYFSPIENFGKIKKITIYPVIGGKQGIKSSLDNNNIIEIPYGLVSWFKLGDNYEDSAGKNTGIINGVENFTIIDGRKSAYLENSHIDFGNSESLNLKNKFAISFWIRTGNNIGVIIEKGVNNPNYKISLMNSGKINFSYSNSGTIQTNESINNINDNKWHNILITNMAIYLDGNLDNIINLNKQLDINSENLVVGKDFKGYLSDLMIYNVSLDNSQVKGIYNLYK